MADTILISHDEFVKRYESGQLLVIADRSKAGDFVLSPLADKHNKPAHYFWTWLGIIVTVPVSIALLLVKWWLAPISFASGLIIINGARKSAAQFVLQNMIDDPTFWEYVLIHDGAQVRDDEGNVYMPEIISSKIRGSGSEPNLD